MPATYIRRLEAGLWMVGLACAAGVLWFAAQAEVYRVRAASLSKTGPVAAHAASSASVAGASVVGQLIGRIDIPALHLSVPVLEGDEATSLQRGLGHIAGTAQLGGLGNAGLAGHRDTFLRPLGKITQGMDIVAVGRDGTFHYVVDSTEVVMPEQVRVLDMGARPELTLITCFPFNYVGAAPKRFIAHAHLLSLSPE